MDDAMGKEIRRKRALAFAKAAEVAALLVEEVAAHARWAAAEGAPAPAKWPPEDSMGRATAEWAEAAASVQRGMQAEQALADWLEAASWWADDAREVKEAEAVMVRARRVVRGKRSGTGAASARAAGKGAERSCADGPCNDRREEDE